jgi:hypothetical protein
MEAYQKELMKRPARVQIDHAEIKKYYTEGAQVSVSRSRLGRDGVWVGGFNVDAEPN